MPVLVVAIMDQKQVDEMIRRAPLKTPIAALEVNPDHLATYPYESILELYARPALTAVLRAWRQGRA